MLHSILYFILAAIGLGFLIFIHELGHYFMARRVGMRVEAFSIGFGKAIYQWEHKGVIWKFCMLPFGGYVKIAGMEKQGPLEPHQIPDGFFGKKPVDRIKVAIAGPIVNILFAFLVFVIIWAAGGRVKSFSDYTHYIGYVDPSSEFYQEGLRPGDQITDLNGSPLNSFKQLWYQEIFQEKGSSISGYEIDYFANVKKPFSVMLPNDKQGVRKLVLQGYPLIPASYLVYERMPNGTANPLMDKSPMQGSGIEYGDQIISIDGEIAFSLPQLGRVINQSMAFVTVQRGDHHFFTRIPRVQIQDLRLAYGEKAELDDWKNINKLTGKLDQLYFIPYNLTPNGTVESSLSYVNKDSKETVHKDAFRSQWEIPLEVNDKIIAIDGTPVTSASQVMQSLQTKKVHVIVKRKATPPLVSWKKADTLFKDAIQVDALEKILFSIGTGQTVTQTGEYYLLNPVVPKPFSELQDAYLTKAIQNQKKEIEEMGNAQEKKAALEQIQSIEKKLMLGISLQDAKVIYNPTPLVLFGDVFDETVRTLSALVTGVLNPKWMSGPVGIVRVMHEGWASGVKEALFWMAVISCNLGILNLLPIPVLDGGHICFALFEQVTKKRIKAKTMERLVLPFVLLLIGLLIFVTYQDILRLFGKWI